MKIVLTILLSYIIGCFSSAYIIGKSFKCIDIRKHGSGNSGATNALRVMGLKLGALTFILDVLKGIVAVYLGKIIMGDNGAYIAGFFVVIGHNWPVFISFKGGKGVATSLGVLLILYWPIVIVSGIIGLALVLFTKYVSLGSITFLGTAPLTYLLISKSFDKRLFILAICFALLTIERHKSNIKRLKEGTENKLGGSR
ncbi:glycerol-3-phosphate 1-O-acyltransferase PlsY [Wansuia hejianensis]|uniref:Glycerol-3-phosphate acyltransferase n=1 Tax=Wansuia hejianensis TaxID=2763667 RepID=A0A926EV49_9FIRM|nr:glycerol-3-phosphate 1-O-acyltransferase PlsY [Wansuia hejianensis]MBC8590433.1 glycerol-3-phosphate 1-O-acyltransferase PlsY [Wansuia hejianensis]